ncbi:Cytochrome c oxidase assembly factor 5, partial [Galemys pyrenaicus]
YATGSPEVVAASFRFRLCSGRFLPAESQRLWGKRVWAAAGGAVMPRYYEDKPEEGACAGVKEDLGACLLQSDCVLQVARPGAGVMLTPETGRQGRRRSPSGRPAVAEGKSPRQCLKEGNCKALKYSFFECKRS